MLLTFHALNAVELCQGLVYESKVRIQKREQAHILTKDRIKNQIVIGDLQIVAILRDWSRAKKLQQGKDYPDYPVLVLDVPMWDLDDTWEFIQDRLRSHFIYEIEPCSAEERWRKLDQYAVKKKGNKRATKVFYDQDDARDFKQDKGDDFEIEFRPGEDTRCLHYCSVAPFCEAKNRLAFRNWGSS